MVGLIPAHRIGVQGDGMRITLLFIFSLQLGLLSQTANAKFTAVEDADRVLDQKVRQDVDQLSYMKALPSMKLALRNDDLVADLNNSYKVLKGQGVADPTVAQVMSQYKKMHSADAAGVINACFSGSTSASAVQQYNCRQYLSMIQRNTDALQQNAMLARPPDDGSSGVIY